MRRAVTVLATISLSLVAVDGAAEAPCPDATPPPPATKGTFTTAPVCIKGRPQRPNAAIDVARLVPRAALPELKKPLVDRIARAAERDPF